MFKSIFSKYLTVLSVIILISFTAMGAVQSILFTRFWLSDKQEWMERAAANVASLTSERTVYDAGTNQYVISANALSPLLRPLTEIDNARVLVTDNQGVTVIGSDGPEVAYSQITIPPSVLEKVQSPEEDNFFRVGTLQGVYSTPQYVSARRVTVGDGQVQIGYVFVSIPADSLGDYIVNNLRVFSLSALGVLALTFVVVYAMTYRLVRPLRQMAVATRRFGEGDFSARIPVKGRDEVAELATALNNMAISLSGVEDMRRSFVANVSHELKTPMTTIAGFIDGILDGTIPPDQQDKYLKIISDEVKRLSRLVRSMLDLSRIDAGELRINRVRFDLMEITCSTLLSFEQRLEEKHINVTGLEDCDNLTVRADFDLIGQVIYNLIENAVKFTDEGGTIAIRFRRQDGRIYYAVRNTGAGIPHQEMLHIFERFYKSDKSRGLDKSGVGLGLYIVKSVINQHHGEITVRSAENEYTEFEFWLPDA
ncbi:MAG: sensor histidine kinase [Acutalibacteraceae bacterium]|jgi:signal transduction histidine kinase